MTAEDLVELWEKLKPFMVKKELLYAADAFISYMDDHGLADSSDAFSHDKHLLASFRTLIDEEEEDDDYE